MKFQSTALRDILNVLVIALYSSVFWTICETISSGGITTTVRMREVVWVTWQLLGNGMGIALRKMNLMTRYMKNIHGVV